MKPLIDIKNIYPLLQSNSFPFLEKTFDDIDEYAILARIQKGICEVITNNNILNDNFRDLNKYVTDYFKNLDVQDEIDNKLQQMAETGELQAIIEAFLKLNSLIAFDNVNEMLQSSNLVNGSYAKTLGFYSLNDGGSAVYKIRNLKENEEVDNAFTFLTKNNLVAELIIKDKTISLLEIGCKPDNTLNCDDKIYNAISKLKNGGTIYIPTGNYQVSHIAIDFEVKNLNIIGQGFESVLNNSTSAWTIEFLTKVADLNFDKFTIACNNNAYGIKFTKPETGKNERIKLNNIYIRNCQKGIYAHNLVYFDMMHCQIGVTNANTNNNENYAMDYDGYEYNSFDTCSFNANTSADFPLVILHQANWLNFFNCEFAYGGIGLLFDTENTSSTSSHVNINNCKLYNLSIGIKLRLVTKSINILNVIQNSFHNKGLSSSERFLKVTSSTNQIVRSLMAENNSFEKVLTQSMECAIEADDNTLINSAFINNQAQYTSSNYMRINNNVPTLFSDFNSQRIRSQNITADGNTTTFTLYNNDKQLPLLARTPLFLVNIPELNIPYSVKTLYNPSNPLQLRGQITFATPPAEGTYAINYQLIY